MEKSTKEQLVQERIQKIISQNSDISRRKAEDFIANGDVTVNGKAVKLGDKASEADKILIQGKPLIVQKKHYLMFYKPKGYVCSKVGENSIYEFLPPSLLLAGVVIVGRLDKDAEGLIFFTNDGDWANAIAHPSTHVEKVYRVWLDVPFTDTAKLMAGVKLDEGTVKPKYVKISPFGYVEISVSIGWHKVVKRLFDAYGYRVKRLLRVQIGGLELPRYLKAGELRDLNQKQRQSVLE
jgi:23S rRNA pseudouridine2605 synthase